MDLTKSLCRWRRAELSGGKNVGGGGAGSKQMETVYYYCVGYGAFTLLTSVNVADEIII